MTTSRSQLSCCIYPAPHGLIAQHDLNRAPVEEVHLVPLLTSMNFTQGVRDMFTEAQVLKVNHARRITNAKERPYQISYIFPRIIRDTDWQQAQEFKASSYCNINSFCINNKLVQPPAQKTERHDNLHDMTTPIIARQGSQDKVSALQDVTDNTKCFLKTTQKQCQAQIGNFIDTFVIRTYTFTCGVKRSRASSCYYSSHCSLSLSLSLLTLIQLVHNSPAHRGTLLNDILPWKKKVYLQHGTQLEQKLLGASLEEFRAAQHALILDDRLGLHLVGCRMPPSRSHRW